MAVILVCIQNILQHNYPIRNDGLHRNSEIKFALTHFATYLHECNCQEIRSKSP